MIPSEEKVRALTHRVLKTLEKTPAVTVTDPAAARKAITEGVGAGVALLKEIHLVAEQKINSLSRRVMPGTREWDELFARYLSEERRRRGL